jgi:hypothetical protein
MQSTIYLPLAPDSLFAPARLFLACRTLELALKAFLSIKGCTMEQLTSGPFGHNLESLLAEVEKRDLQSVFKMQEHHRFEITRASTYYFEKVLEYPALMEAVFGYPNLPNANILIEVAELASHSSSRTMPRCRVGFGTGS